MNDSLSLRPRFLAAPLAVPLAVLLAMLLGSLQPVAAQGRSARNGDYIAAIVNQELVTAGEVERRVERAKAEAARSGARLPLEAEVRRQVTDSLIDERVIVTSARDSGMRVDDPDIDRAVQSVAAQNQITLPVLRERLRAEGIEYSLFRANLRDQMLIERMREREVYKRIAITDDDVEKLLAEQRAAASQDTETDIAQILIPVPENTGAEPEAALRARAQAALERARAGEDFAKLALELSSDSNRERGGRIGLRPASRLPDAFVEAVKPLAEGDVAPKLLRTGAGFHVLKLVERRGAGDLRVTQTRARHVLLRTSPQLNAETATRRLAEYKRQISTGARQFDDIARQFSEDGSAAAGGDLGFASPGVMVPEFEEAMNALAINGLSDPVVSRFGVHLIQVLERREVAVDPKQIREQARNLLREQRFDAAYLDWTKELRSRAYVEMREPPQ